MVSAANVSNLFQVSTVAWRPPQASVRRRVLWLSAVVAQKGRYKVVPTLSLSVSNATVGFFPFKSESVHKAWFLFGFNSQSPTGYVHSCSVPGVSERFLCRLMPGGDLAIELPWLVLGWISCGSAWQYFGSLGI
jgi:hypothetical protein